MRKRGMDQPAVFRQFFESGQGFGPSLFRAVADRVPASRVHHRKTQLLVQRLRKKLPRTPGVYGMLGPKGHLIYVGKAKNLRSRLLSYFRQSSDPKAHKIIRHTRTLIWEEWPCEFTALLRELELIRRHRPRFNVLGQPGRQRYVYLCLGRAPASYAYFVKQPTGHEQAVYGPFVGRGFAGDAIRALNQHFALRDCPNTTRFQFADQPPLFDHGRNPQCLRHELGTCLAPCAGLCTSKQYQKQLKLAKRFLDGQDSSLLEQLTRLMQAAAAEQKFEQAMLYRDRLRSFTWLLEKLEFIRTARASHSFVYRVTGCDQVPRWLLIHGGVVHRVLREPTNTKEAELVQRELRACFQAALSANQLLERCVDSVLIVTSWFRKKPEERAHLMSPNDAEAFCQAV